MRPALLLAILGLVGCAATTTSNTTQPSGPGEPTGDPSSPAEQHPATLGAALRGELDPTFAQGPNAALDQVIPKLVEVDAEGRIYVSGETTACLQNRDVVSVVVRLDAGGALDPTFAKGGRLCMDRALRVDALALAGDGSVYVAGNRPADGFAFVDHYDQAGARDETFGRAGVYAATGSSAWFLHVAVAGGAVFAVGQHGNSGLVAKFGKDGKLVPTFGTAGIVVARDKTSNPSRPVVAGDRLVVAVLGSDDFNGWELQSFDMATGAMQRHSQMPLPMLVGAGRSVDTLAAPDLVTSATGDLFVGGYRQEGNTQDRVAVGRIHGTLAPDGSFGTGGIFGSDMFFGSTPPNLVPTTDGMVIVGGNDRRTGAKVGSAAIVRVTTQGQRDPSFGDGGALRFTDPSRARARSCASPEIALRGRSSCSRKKV